MEGQGRVMEYAFRGPARSNNNGSRWFHDQSNCHKLLRIKRLQKTKVSSALVAGWQYCPTCADLKAKGQSVELSISIPIAITVEQ